MKKIHRFLFLMAGFFILGLTALPDATLASLRNAPIGGETLPSISSSPVMSSSPSFNYSSSSISPSSNYQSSSAISSSPSLSSGNNQSSSLMTSSSVSLAISVSSTNPLEISADAGTILGKLPELFKADVWMSSWGRREYITSKFFNDNNIGKIQLTLPLGSTISFEDYQKTLKDTFATGTVGRIIADEAKKSGFYIIGGHWPRSMPRWLSSREGDDRPYNQTAGEVSVEAVSPPKCYKDKCVSMNEIICYTNECVKSSEAELSAKGYITGWAGMIDYTLRYMRDDLGIKNLGYYFGHEANEAWLGSEEDFYKLYGETYRAAKKIDPNILVGGTGPWRWDGKRPACDESYLYTAAGKEICEGPANWSINGDQCKEVKTAKNNPNCKPVNENFLHYVKTQGIGTDFVNYHMFGELPLVGQFKQIADTMKKWLEDNGFSKNTPLYPADWTIWANGYPADYLDTEKTSSYLTQAVINMSKAGIQWHGYDFDVGDDYKGGAQFLGTWPIYTKDQAVKPSYNGFRLLSMLSGKQEGGTANQIKIFSPDDDFIASVASQTEDKNTTRLLISNFIPHTPKMIEQYVISSDKSCMLSKGYSENELSIVANWLKQAMKDNPRKKGESIKDYVVRILKLKIVPNDFLKSKITQDLLFCSKVRSDNFQYASANRREVNVVVSNLSPGEYSVKKYLIDKDHSNSCSFNKKTETSVSATVCGINGEIDRRVALAKGEAGASGQKAASDYLKTKGYSDNDITVFKKIIIDCGAKKKCVALNRLAKNYSKLEKCRRQGVGAPQLCTNESVKADTSEAYKAFIEKRNQVFYYDSANSIDKLNNLKGVALEKVEQKTIQGNQYHDTIKMQPYSVLLVEIAKTKGLAAIRQRSFLPAAVGSISVWLKRLGW
ncbi:MAG: hypothetical protein KGI39_01335 [Patescibacteria group bacterium]|nr:hypothetical protein [Patescibacteria group bacterium]